jgi:hypothetical protein
MSTGPSPVETEIPAVDGEQRADVITQLWTAGDGGCHAHSWDGNAPTGLSVGDDQSCHQLVAARRAISAVSSMTTALRVPGSGRGADIMQRDPGWD